MRRCLLFLCSAGALAAQAASPRPAISVNESSAAAIFPGWPVLAQVSVINDSRQADLRLAPWRGAWPRAIRFVVTGLAGKLEEGMYGYGDDIKR